MEFSFANDEFVEGIVGRRGIEIVREIYFELRRRYEECDSTRIERHIKPNGKENLCDYCFRTLRQNPNILGNKELLELNDFYAGLIALERAKFKR